MIQMALQKRSTPLHFIQWAEVSCRAPDSMVDHLSAFLTELSGTGVCIDNLSVDTFSLDTIEDSPLKTIKSYFPADQDLEQKVQSISTFIAESGVNYPGFIFSPPTIALLKEEDWANSWKEHFKPARIGRRLVIKPSWEAFSACEGDIVLEVDPGMAFGTGTHPTTRLCLEALEKIFYKEEPFADKSKKLPTLLDVGTGSGILSIAAMKFGASGIKALDIDPEAVTVARENLALNGIHDQVEVATTPLCEIAATFDIIVANILAEELVRLAPELACRLKPGGILLLSGILNEKEELVIEGFSERNLALLEITREEEWSCLAYCQEG